MATSEWHWEQGAKFAVEGIKTSLLLNGAAAIALMTFANAHPELVRALKTSIFLFAVGAMMSAVAFLAAYLTQLKYGNAEIPGAQDHQREWKKGQCWNTAAVLLFVASILMFVIGCVVVLCSWSTI